MRRLFLLAIALPALALAMLGCVLIGAFSRQMENRAAAQRDEMAERCAQMSAYALQDQIDKRLDRLAASTDEAGRIAVLRALVDGDPLVRNAFLWRKGEGCVWPRFSGYSETERDFLQRYQPLFSGVVPWIPPSPSPQADAPPPSRGYRRWASGDRPDLLAWTRLADGAIAGFELESMRLLADLANDLRRGTRFGPVALVDASGSTLLPASAPVATAIPHGEAPFGPFFPQWRFRVYDNSRQTAVPVRFAVAITAVLLGLLLCSLVAGGALLLHAARKERQDALRKTEFVSNVSHELRTPLTSIRMFAELLASGRLPEGERRRKALETISSESARLSRLEQNRRRYTMERVDLAGIVADASGSNLPRPVLEAHADRDAVRQILLNLLDNAAKYAPGAPPEIELARSADGHLALLRVLDRGPGVPPRARKHIFERFYRADDSITRETNGNGLGLSIARGLARGMGGDLAYAPRSGGGSIFTLSLPAERTQP